MAMFANATDVDPTSYENGHSSQGGIQKVESNAKGVMFLLGATVLVCFILASFIVYLLIRRRQEKRLWNAEKGRYIRLPRQEPDVSIFPPPKPTRPRLPSRGYQHEKRTINFLALPPPIEYEESVLNRNVDTADRKLATDEDKTEQLDLKGDETTDAKSSLKSPLPSPRSKSPSPRLLHAAKSSSPVDRSHSQTQVAGSASETFSRPVSPLVATSDSFVYDSHSRSSPEDDNLTTTASAKSRILGRRRVAKASSLPQARASRPAKSPPTAKRRSGTLSLAMNPDEMNRKSSVDTDDNTNYGDSDDESFIKDYRCSKQITPSSQHRGALGKHLSTGALVRDRSLDFAVQARSLAEQSKSGISSSLPSLAVSEGEKSPRSSTPSARQSWSPEIKPDSVGPRGAITFSLLFILRDQALQVTRLRCYCLPSRDGGDPNIYVKIRLLGLPHRTRSLRTAVARGSWSPNFKDEEFKFEGFPLTFLRDATLLLKVYRYILSGFTSEFVGECSYPLRDAAYLRQLTAVVRDLQPRST